VEGGVQTPGERVRAGGWTRARALRVAAAGGAALGGGVLLGRRGGAGASAAPSPDQDAEILAFFLQVEQVQEGLYRAALRAGRLDGDLLTFVRTVAPQEGEHASFLADRLGGRARPRPRSDFSEAVRTSDSLLKAAIDLEELTISAYVGQGGNLTRDAVSDVARILSVEARQAAWIRDLGGEVPAPRAADPAREPEEVLAALRERSYVL
jgi:hypothetical protein